jgi:hypothetical protein
LLARQRDQGRNEENASARPLRDFLVNQALTGSGRCDADQVAGFDKRG